MFIRRGGVGIVKSGETLKNRLWVMYVSATETADYVSIRKS